MSINQRKRKLIIPWLSVLLILITFILGKYMGILEQSENMIMLKIHVILGITIFILTVFRIFSKFEDKLSLWVHYIFTLLIIGVVVLGLSTLFLGSYTDAIIHGNAELIQNKNEIQTIKAHGIMAVILMVLLVMHVIGTDHTN